MLKKQLPSRGVCSHRRFIGQPGAMWDVCGKPAQFYARRKWWCKNHFKPVRTPSQMLHHANRDS